MTLPEDHELVREIRIAARPETIFPFLVDPDKMKRWKGITVNLDPQPGGIYQANLNGQDVMRGEYLEIVPYSRVVFSFGWEGENSPLPPGSSKVEISLIPEGNVTLLRLRHFGLPDQLQPSQGHGWDHYLKRLITVAEGHDPGPDPWAVSGAMSSEVEGLTSA